MHLKVKINGQEGFVDRDKYAKAKLRQLREFGYPTLTIEEVQKQIDAVIAKKEIGEGLTVIGAFMKDEVLEQTK